MVSLLQDLSARRRLMLFLAFLPTIALLIVAGVMFMGSEEPNESDVRRQIVDPPRELSNFTLTDQNGEAMSLSDLREQPVLLFFGYTNCPDVCHTTMAEFRQVRRELGEEADKVAFVFVSVDGERDTPERVAAFVSNFGSGFIGLTGPEDQVRAIGNEFFLFFERAEVSGTASELAYLVDHTGYSYLIDEQGRLRYIYPYGTPSEVMVEDLQGVIN